MDFKPYIRFKDGFVYQGEVFDEHHMPGDGNFLEMIARGRVDDRDITLTTQDGVELKRKYRDISSVEILFL